MDLFRSLNSCIAVFLSRLCKTWAITGGTLRHWFRITFWHCRRIYSGRPKIINVAITLRENNYISNYALIPNVLALTSKRGFLIVPHPPCKQTLAAVVVLLTIITITTHCWHSSCSPLHEQLLEELGAGGMLSAMHTHNPPYERWLVGMEHVHECQHVIVSSYWLF